MLKGYLAAINILYRDSYIFWKAKLIFPWQNFKRKKWLSMYFEFSNASWVYTKYCRILTLKPEYFFSDSKSLKCIFYLVVNLYSSQTAASMSCQSYSSHFQVIWLNYYMHKRLSTERLKSGQGNVNYITLRREIT